jgi:predicted metalloprotease with PDZ domain
MSKDNKMKIDYKLKIEKPENHYIWVELKGTVGEALSHLDFFLPSWSPGSYLMREYSKNLRLFSAQTKLGVTLPSQQIDKGTFRVDFSSMKKDVKNSGAEFLIKYRLYCKELTVRTSHVDSSHAFIHGPSVFMGVKGQEIVRPTLEVVFPNEWGKITTGLKDISKERETFLYEAENYDVLLDSPLEIGCHYTDGFTVEGLPHELAFYGDFFSYDNKFKKDIQTIVEHISQNVGEIPYEKYTFITHLVPKVFGGLEHLNSTALQFCPLKLGTPEGYRDWLALVSHEYFHTWNVKRIRPKGLGPFDYTQEAHTTMLWLAEGLTSFMDELFVARTKLVSLEDYLEWQKKNINRYLSVEGRRFHTLEESSFNAWTVLYRPNENSINSTVSYYLKGGISFMVLHFLLVEKGSDINELIQLLWSDYKSRPNEGLTSDEVFSMVEKLGGKETLESFLTMIQTTEEIDLEFHLKSIGIQIEYEGQEEGQKKDVCLGINVKNEGNVKVITQVILDGPGFKAGLNAGDQVVALNGFQIDSANYSSIVSLLESEKSYSLHLFRLGKLIELNIVPERSPLKVKNLKVVDREKCLKVLGIDS